MRRKPGSSAVPAASANGKTKTDLPADSEWPHDEHSKQKGDAIHEDQQRAEEEEDRRNRLVEEALFKRAVGYTVERERPMMYQGQITIAKFSEHVPPDAAAARFWLLNRCPNRWANESKIEPEPAENPLMSLYNRLIGTAIRPKDEDSGQPDHEEKSGETAAAASAQKHGQSDDEQA